MQESSVEQQLEALKLLNDGGVLEQGQYILRPTRLCDSPLGCNQQPLLVGAGTRATSGRCWRTGARQERPPWR